MKQSLIFKTLSILSLVVISIFAGAGYLFNQSDEKLLQDIRSYNLNSAMEALDARLGERLALNKEQMEETLNMIVKNSTSFLLNFDEEGLKKSLLFDMQQEDIAAVNVWDNALEQNFITAVKVDGEITFSTQLPKKITEYTKLEKDIVIKNDIFEDHIGKVTLYYDEGPIISKIKELKTTTKLAIKNFDAEIDQQKDKANIIKLVIIISAIIIVLALISILLLKFVNTPLIKLKEGLDHFFLFLQNKEEDIDPISIATNDEFGQMADSLNENIYVSAALHKEIYELNTNLEGIVEEKTRKVTTLLDNADQGFLSFGQDLIIEPEYSKECKKIFKKEIAGMKVSELLYKDEHKKHFYEETLCSLFDEKNALKVKTIISLLQSEFIINRKAIQVKYKLLEHGQFMLIFTDITAKKILEKKVNREKDILKMIVTVIGDSEEFFELYDDFNLFIASQGNFIENDKTPLHNATELYRTIHTFKGLFAQKEMKQITSRLHKFESELSDTMAKQEYTNDSLQEVLTEYDFAEWIEKDIATIREILGDELLSKRGKITVHEEKIAEIEEKILLLAQQQNNPDSFRPVVDDIKSLRYRTVQSLFASYPKLIDQLSERVGKSIYSLDIIVDQDLKVSNKVKPFIKSLVHVFRNSVDHGIESMDERAEIGKDEIGTISCRIYEKEGALVVSIADDGAGLNVAKIRDKAISLDIDVTDFTQEDLQQLIFSDRLSTANEVTETSGRGVGMAAVKNEVDRLNGNIKIHSQQGKGTTFEFTIPLYS